LATTTAPSSNGSAPATASRANVPGNASPDPLTEIRFKVEISGQTIGHFSECGGIAAEYEVLEYQEGGEMGFVHKLRGQLKFPNLTLKRGVTYEDALLRWFGQPADRASRGSVTITMLDHENRSVRRWRFDKAFPVKWQGPALNAKSTNVATETLEIAHEGPLVAS
jgi:phage tail-like protein